MMNINVTFLMVLLLQYTFLVAYRLEGNSSNYPDAANFARTVATQNEFYDGKFIVVVSMC